MMRTYLYGLAMLAVVGCHQVPAKVERAASAETAGNEAEARYPWVADELEGDEIAVWDREAAESTFTIEDFVRARGLFHRGALAADEFAKVYEGREVEVIGCASTAWFDDWGTDVILIDDTIWVRRSDCRWAFMLEDVRRGDRVRIEGKLSDVRADRPHLKEVGWIHRLDR